MACGQIEYLEEYTYVYNAGTGSNVGSMVYDTQRNNALYIRLKDKYNCLPEYLAVSEKKKEWL